MNREEKPFSEIFSQEQNEQAAQWVALHERGLSKEETRAYEKWLLEDINNEACFFEHQVAWASFDVMDEWRPAYSSTPNPDLFETKKKKKWSSFLALGGLAAAVLLGLFFLQLTLQETPETEIAAGTTYKSQNNEKHFLEDGSSFYLLPGSEVRVIYSDTERTIGFVSGEAEFSVAHDSTRPFVVRSKIGSVTALGTVFSVKKDSDSWEVFVTEGRVQVDEGNVEQSEVSEPDTFSAELVAGQKFFEELSDEEFAPTIEIITASELEQKLAWKDQIIDMVSAPLEEILHEFSRFNDRDVLIVDEDLKGIRMSVAIKADNLQDFIDLLELTEGVRAVDSPSGSILLTRSSN